MTAPTPDAGRLGEAVEHVGGCNPGCKGDDHLLISETPAGGHDSGAVIVSSPVEREVAPVPPAGQFGEGEREALVTALHAEHVTECQWMAEAGSTADQCGNCQRWGRYAAVWLAGQRETVARAIEVTIGLGVERVPDCKLCNRDFRICPTHVGKAAADAALAALGAGGA